MNTDPSVETDRRRAEALLFEIAANLLRAALTPEHRRHHVRALELKKEVAGWTRSAPSPEQRQQRVEEIIALHENVRGRVVLERGREPSSPACASIGDSPGGGVAYGNGFAHAEAR